MENNVIQMYEGYLRNNGKLPVTIVDYIRPLNTMAIYLMNTYNVCFDIASVGSIKGYMLDSYYGSLSHTSLDTRNQYVKIIKGFFKYLVDAGYITTDPASILQTRKVKKQDELFEEEDKKMFTSEEVLKLMTSEEGYNKLRNDALIAMAAGTGMRATELAELTVGAYRSIRQGMIRCHRKGGIYRWVAVADYVFPLVDKYLTTRGVMYDNEPLFKSNRGGSLDRKSIYKAIATRQRKEGIDTGVHKFRHTFLNAIESVEVAADMASHESVKTTQNFYRHSTVEDRITAANSVPWAKERKE